MGNIGLYREAINILKSNYKFPNTGFIAGGSLANTIWELKSGNSAIINDIDIFIFDGKIEYSEEVKNSKKFNYIKNDVRYFGDYTGINFTSFTKEYYIINKSDRDGIYNYIYYQSNKRTPQLIINSFDLNCVQIGYSIDEDKFYYTSGFDHFLNTGEIQIVNLMTPSHTALRIIKKGKDLGLSINKFEVDLIKHAMNNKFRDFNKIRFTNKYLKIYNELKDDLSMFSISRDHATEGYLMFEKNISVELHYHPKMIFHLLILI